MGRSQRDKGKRGERLAAQELKDLGYQACRGVQHQGGPGSPDLRTSIDGVHMEVKFVEREQIRMWMRQAADECGDSVPVVLHKKSREEWLVTLPLMMLNEFCERLAAARGAEVPEVGAEELPA